MTVHKIHLFIVADSSKLVAKFIQIILYFYLCWWLFIFTIWLIHFRHNLNLLFNDFNCFFALQAPSLCSDVLNECILTRLTFLWILRCNVDCVHLFVMQRIIILKQTFYKKTSNLIKSILFILFISFPHDKILKILF